MDSDVHPARAVEHNLASALLAMGTAGGVCAA